MNVVDRLIKFKDRQHIVYLCRNASEFAAFTSNKDCVEHEDAREISKIVHQQTGQWYKFHKWTMHQWIGVMQ